MRKDLDKNVWKPKFLTCVKKETTHGTQSTRVTPGALHRGRSV